MRLRATIQIRNDHMLKAREEKKLTQADVASLAGVSTFLISRLERLDYPSNYKYEEALLIADALGILPDQVMTERMKGWRGVTKFQKIDDISVDKLLASQEINQKHLILPSPSESLENQEIFDIIKKFIKTLSYREQTIIKMRYGLEGYKTHTLKETGKLFQISIARAREIEAKAIRKLQTRVKIEYLSNYFNGE